MVLHGIVGIIRSDAHYPTDTALNAEKLQNSVPINTRDILGAKRLQLGSNQRDPSEAQLSVENN